MADPGATPDTAATADQPSHSTAGPLRRLLELLVLCSFAIAQPLLDVTGQSPETFVFYRVAGWQIVLFAVLLIAVPPLVLWLVVLGVGAVSRRAGLVVHLAITGVLVALVVLQAAKAWSALRGPLLVGLALLVAAGALWLVARSAVARSYVTFLTPAPLAFALLFLLVSPTGSLVRIAEEGSAAEGSGDGGEGPPVVMILLDELPLVSLLDSTGQVNEGLFPNFARVASTSTWYRNATTVNGFTQYAVPAMLTGNYPERKLAPSYADHPVNLFSLLAPDYRIRAFETITQLCDPSLCDQVAPTGDDRGFDQLLGQTWEVAKTLAAPYDSDASVSDQFAEESAADDDPEPRAAPSGPRWDALRENQPVRFRQFLAGLRPHDEPTFDFLHLLLPHNPWRYLPSGLTYPYQDLGGRKGGWSHQEWPMVVNRQRHLLQLGYTDRLLGEVIDRLERRGMWDESLVVVTADHGEALVPGWQGRRVNEDLQTQAQVAWVPVFVKEPGQTRLHVSDDNFEMVDLLPTVADLLDVDVPRGLDGMSHAGSTAGRAGKVFFNDPGQRRELSDDEAFEVVLDGVPGSVVQTAQGWDGIYAMPAYPDWVGMRLVDVDDAGVAESREPSRMTAVLADGIELDRVDPGDAEVPSLITGALQNTRWRSAVAIVVGGYIQAVSPIYRAAGTPTFAAMVPDGYFSGGGNDVQLFEVVDGKQPVLRPITIVED
jgi:hypothetical protein